MAARARLARNEQSGSIVAHSLSFSTSLPFYTLPKSGLAGGSSEGAEACLHNKRNQKRCTLCMSVSQVLRLALESGVCSPTLA